MSAPSWAEAAAWCADRRIILDPAVPKNNTNEEFWPLAGAYDALTVRYPELRGALVAIVYDPYATGFSATTPVGPGRATIAFTPIDNAKFVDSPDTAPRTPLEAWMHELGHVYHNAHPGLIEQLPVALARARIDPHEISNYAAEKPEECFAEAFCLLNRGGSLSGLDPSLQERLRVMWDLLGVTPIAKAAPQDPWRAVHAAADSYVTRFREPFIGSVRALRRRVTTEQLEESVRLGTPTRGLIDAIDHVKLAKIAAEPADLATKVYSELIATTVQGQAAYVESVWGAGGAAIVGRFDVTSPFVLRAAETLTADLIRGVGEETKTAVRRVIFNAVRDGIPPRDAAGLIRQIIGLTTGQALSVEKFAVGLAERGAEQAFIDRRVARKAERLLNDRALMIARTETMRAANRGQQALWKEMQNAGVVGQDFGQRWMVTPDDRLCPECAPMSGQVVQLGYLFRQTERGVLPSQREPVAGVNMESPPLHPRCRCVVVAYVD